MAPKTHPAVALQSGSASMTSQWSRPGSSASPPAQLSSSNSSPTAVAPGSSASPPAQLSSSSSSPTAVAEEFPICIASYNVGLTSQNVLDQQAHDPLNYFYQFSERLESDLVEAFGPERVLCRLCIYVSLGTSSVALGWIWRCNHGLASLQRTIHPNLLHSFFIGMCIQQWRGGWTHF